MTVVAVRKPGGRIAFVRLRSREELALDLEYCAEQDRHQRRAALEEAHARQADELADLVARYGQEAVARILNTSPHRPVSGPSSRSPR